MRVVIAAEIEVDSVDAEAIAGAAATGGVEARVAATGAIGADGIAVLDRGDDLRERA